MRWTAECKITWRVIQTRASDGGLQVNMITYNKLYAQVREWHRLGQPVLICSRLPTALWLRRWVLTKSSEIEVVQWYYPTFKRSNYNGGREPVPWYFYIIGSSKYWMDFGALFKLHQKSFEILSNLQTPTANQRPWRLFKAARKHNAPTPSEEIVVKSIETPAPRDDVRILEVGISAFNFHLSSHHTLLRWDYLEGGSKSLWQNLAYFTVTFSPYKAIHQTWAAKFWPPL